MGYKKTGKEAKKLNQEKVIEDTSEHKAYRKKFTKMSTFSSHLAQSQFSPHVTSVTGSFVFFPTTY